MYFVCLHPCTLLGQVALDEKRIRVYDNIAGYDGRIVFYFASLALCFNAERFAVQRFIVFAGIGCGQNGSDASYSSLISFFASLTSSSIRSISSGVMCSSFSW